MNAHNGAALFLETLIDEGVRYIFGNPGSTELPFMDALVNENRLTYVLCLHESVAVGAGEGYALATGKVGVLSLHAAPGLGNAMGLLYNAKRARTPLLVTAGNQPEGGQFHEIILSEDLVRMAEPLTKWAYEVRRVEDLEQAVRRAIKVALTPPAGPVFLSFPGDVVLAPAKGLQNRSVRIDSRFTAAPETIRRASALLAKAKQPVIVAGSEAARSGAEEVLARLAEQIGAKVFEESIPSRNGFPMDHSLYAGRLPIVPRPFRERLAGSDLVFLVGTEAFLFSSWQDFRPLPEDTKVIHLDLDPWEIGKNFSVDVSLFGDPRETLGLLLNEVISSQSDDERQRASERREIVEKEIVNSKQKMMPEAKSNDENTAEGMSLSSFHAAIGEAVPKGVAIVDEAFTSTGPRMRQAVAEKAAYYYGRKGGAIGNGLPMALGLKIGMPDRPVVCISGDGSSMYSNQTLWTSAKYGVGAVYVIANNGSYRILKERVLKLDGRTKEFHRFIAMDLDEPRLDFLKLAESMGVPAKRAITPGELTKGIREAIDSGRPCLLDAVIRPEPF